MKVKPSTKGFNKRVVSTETALLREYGASLKTVKAQVLAIYEKYSSAGVLTYAEMTKYNRLNNLFKSITIEIGKISGKTQSGINTLAADAYEESFFRMGYAIETGASEVAGAAINLGFGGLQPSVIKAAIENPMRYIAFDGLKNSMLIKARSTITQGLIQGLSYFDMAKQIQSDFEGRASSAIRIARTEAGRAQSLGNVAAIDAAVEGGAEGRKFWIATMDGRTRDSHAHMDGKNADEDGMFRLAGIKVPGPMADGLPAGEIINCRCTLGVDIEGVKRGARRYPDGVAPYKTYEEWRDGK